MDLQISNFREEFHVHKRVVTFQLNYDPHTHSIQIIHLLMNLLQVVEEMNQRQILPMLKAESV